MLKTYNHRNKEQLSRCSVRIRHNDKCVKCRFFVVQGNGPASLGMPHIEMLGVRVMCETNVQYKQEPTRTEHRLWEWRQNPHTKLFCF